MSKDIILDDGSCVMEFNIPSDLYKKCLKLAKEVYEDTFLEHLPVKYLPPNTTISTDKRGVIDVDTVLNEDALVSMWVAELLIEHSEEVMKLKDDPVYSVWDEVEVKESGFELAELGTGAKKHLDGKARLDLVPPEMILALADVLTYGAQKYSDRNWEKGINYMTSYAAAMRHLMQWASCTDIDEESGLKHIEQAMLNIGMIVTQTRRGRDDLDDRVV